MTSNLPTIPSDDGWDAAAAENAERVIKGTLLKFADWNWTKGKDTELEKGISFAALSTAAGWVKWWEGKPIQYKMREPGRSLPEREELGDLDQSEWEVGPNGELKDPWQNTRFVYLVDPKTAEAYTFATATWGGRQAVNDLAEQIQRMRYGRPGAVPLVELDAAPMQTKFGRKSKPFFKVVEWVGGEQPAIDQPDAPALAPAAAPGEASPFATEHEAKLPFDDEIPF
jgi:hypothetical protein